MTAHAWQQIAAALRLDLQSAPPGAPLPTEAALARRFAVHRHTVRRALDDLARAGLLRAEQGRGRFVAEEILPYAVTPRPRFSEWIRAHDKTPLGQILSLAEAPAEPSVAQALHLEPGAPVLILRRLGLADEIPVSLADHHFPARIPGLAAALREAPTITDALARCGIPDYLRRSTQIAARLPDPLEARLLRLPPTLPLLITESLNTDPAGIPIEHGIARYPSSRVNLVFEP